jgi:AGZA family xanthine/uracil permease-like MFS transporter
VIGAQAFQASPTNHAPAVVLAIIPNIALWAQIKIDTTLQVAGTNAEKVGIDALRQVDVWYSGMTLLGGGSVLAGMVLGAMAAFIIDRKLVHAAIAAFIGAALAFIGLIHGPHLGWMVSPLVALGYALFGAVCLLLSRQAGGSVKAT